MSDFAAELREHLDRHQALLDQRAKDSDMIGELTDALIYIHNKSLQLFPASQALDNMELIHKCTTRVLLGVTND